ncbi:OsmC family protein [Virgibacillus senegalensis]|uniref:OsmC family protein n=1 Tax=Virgibacillus senegalensis TaxID=1499679 RepID=UPI00069D6429|nr:OsmC family protein [Virgibacillus senegalensis]
MKNVIRWNEKLSFTGSTPSGHPIHMDASKDAGGENRGARPTELLLNAVAGCTAIDIVSILKKMRLNPDSFEVEIDGERAESHPKRFTSIHVHYVLEGDLPEDKVVRAIQLSKDTYCSVAHSVNAELTVSYSINGEQGSKEM